MAVAIVSSSTTGTGDTHLTSIDVPVPAGTAAEHVAVAALGMWESSNPAVTPPTGFTQFVNQANGNKKLKLFWKRLSAADSGNYTFSWSGLQYTVGHAVLLSGVLASGDPIGADFQIVTATSGTVPSASVGPLAYEPGLLHFVSNEDVATGRAHPTGFTGLQPGDFLASSYRIPGTTGSHTASGGTVTPSTVLVAALVALQPGSGAPPPEGPANSDGMTRMGKSYY